MRPGSLAILGIAAYSAFLVANMPARWAAERLLPKPGPVSLHEIEGTVWHGNARAAIGSAASLLTVDRVEWRFLPTRLLQGRAAYDASLAGAGFEARAEAGRGFAAWTLRDLNGRADASLATAILPWLGAWRPEGSLHVSAPSLDIAGREARGELRIDWTEAATSLSEVRPLGSYRADVKAEGPVARIALTTLSGPLRVTAQGQLEWPSRLALAGEARAEGPGAQALQPLLDLIGPRKADGSRAIDWRTR